MAKAKRHSTPKADKIAKPQKLAAEAVALQQSLTTGLGFVQLLTERAKGRRFTHAKILMVAEAAEQFLGDARGYSKRLRAALEAQTQSVVS